MPTLHLLLQIPPPPARSGLFATFLSSGPMALFVLGLLLALSLACWTIMLWKVLALRRAENQGRRFLEVFRGSRRFGEVQAASGKLAASPLVGLFQAGYAELDHQIKAARELEAESSARYRIKSLEAVERSLKRAEGVELRSLAHLSGDRELLPRCTFRDHPQGHQPTGDRLDAQHSGFLNEALGPGRNLVHLVHR